MSKTYNRAIKVGGEIKKIGTPVVKVLEFDVDSNVMRATGATVPTDADAGYAKGCIFIQTDGGVATTVYLNEGSATSADFNAVESAASGVTGVTAGNGLTGGGTEGSVTVAVGAGNGISVAADAVALDQTYLESLTDNLKVTLTAASATAAEKAIYGKYTLGATFTAGGSVMAVRGEMNIPNSGSMGSGTYAYGTQGKLIGGTSSTIDAGSGHVAGVLGQLDITNTTTTSGHIACLIASIQDSSGTARASVDGIYVELPQYGSGAKMNSVLKGFGAADYAFDLGGTNIATSIMTGGAELILSSAVSTGGVHIPFIKVGATQYYINAYTS